MRIVRAFTLVELLVVVTIIVVLLSLLLPAMGKAIYQANLAVCASRQDGVIVSVQSYAFNNKQHYPARGVEDQTEGGTKKFFNPMQVYNLARNYDLRAPLKGYIASVNQQMQCPLIEPVDMETITQPDVVIESSYLFFWGWVYVTGGSPEAGMYKMGDKFGWAGREYNFLIADMDIDYRGIYVQGSHPDRSPQRMLPQWYENNAQFGATFTYSRWSKNGRGRGLLDTNYGFDDGSVSRYVDVLDWNETDERFDRIPLEYNQAAPGDILNAPRS